MPKKKLISELQNSCIKNDKGVCRDLYFELCSRCGLHEGFEATEYKWPWIFESNLGLLQHAPERRFIRGKKPLELADLERMERHTRALKLHNTRQMQVLKKRNRHITVAA